MGSRQAVPLRRPPAPSPCAVPLRRETGKGDGAGCDFFGGSKSCKFGLTRFPPTRFLPKPLTMKPDPRWESRRHRLRYKRDLNTRLLRRSLAVARGRNRIVVGFHMAHRNLLALIGEGKHVTLGQGVADRDIAKHIKPVIDTEQGALGTVADGFDRLQISVKDDNSIYPSRSRNASNYLLQIDDGKGCAVDFEGAGVRKVNQLPIRIEGCGIVQRLVKLRARLSLRW